MSTVVPVPEQKQGTSGVIAAPDEKVKVIPSCRSTTTNGELEVVANAAKNDREGMSPSMSQERRTRPTQTKGFLTTKCSGSIPHTVSVDISLSADWSSLNNKTISVSLDRAAGYYWYSRVWTPLRLGIDHRRRFLDALSPESLSRLVRMLSPRCVRIWR